MSLERLLDRFMPPGADVDGAFMLKRVDLCHLGFWLGLGAHFLNGDPRLPPLAQAVLSAQFDDGGWNYRMRNHPGTHHGSFHTTFNVLENLRIASARGVAPHEAFRDAEARALEFMLAHRFYRSDKTARRGGGKPLQAVRLAPRSEDLRATGAREMRALYVV